MVKKALKFVFKDRTLGDKDITQEGSVLIRGRVGSMMNGKINVTPALRVDPKRWETREQLLEELSKAFGKPVKGIKKYKYDTHKNLEDHPGLPEPGGVYVTDPPFNTLPGLLKMQKEKNLWVKTGGFACQTCNYDAEIQCPDSN